MSGTPVYSDAALFKHPPPLPPSVPTPATPPTALRVQLMEEDLRKLAGVTRSLSIACARARAGSCSIQRRESATASMPQLKVEASQGAALLKPHSSSPTTC